MAQVPIQQPRFAPLLARQDEIVALLRAKTQRKFIARKLRITNIATLDLFARHLRRTGVLELKTPTTIRRRKLWPGLTFYISPIEHEKLAAKCYAAGLSRSDYVAALIRRDISDVEEQTK